MPLSTPQVVKVLTDTIVGFGSTTHTIEAVRLTDGGPPGQWAIRTARLRNPKQYAVRLVSTAEWTDAESACREAADHIRKCLEVVEAAEAKAAQES